MPCAARDEADDPVKPVGQLAHLTEHRGGGVKWTGS